MNKIKITNISKYELLISILKSILRIKNTYRQNGIVITNGTISFSKKIEKFVIYFFFIVSKINENNK
jgi:hypothetical protein